jgi:hypothetical protein
MSAVQRTTLAGGIGLFGLVAGFGAIMALFATAAEWHEEHVRAGWPIVGAIVERADVWSSRVAPSCGGMTWRLHYRLRYEAQGHEEHATLTSRSVSSEAQAARLSVGSPAPPGQ